MKVRTMNSNPRQPATRMLGGLGSAGLTVLLLASLAASPSAARASDDPGPNRQRFGVETDIGSRFMRADEISAFSRGGSLGSWQLTALWLPAAHDERLGVDLRLGRAGSSVRNFTRVETDLVLTSLTAGARWRHNLVGAFWAVGRIGAGAEHARVIFDEGLGASLSGGAWTPAVDSSVAIEFVAELRGATGSVKRAFVVRLEGGWDWRLSADIGDLSRPRGASVDVQPIDSVPVRVGELPLSGWNLRGAIGFVF